MMFKKFLPKFILELIYGPNKKIPVRPKITDHVYVDNINELFKFFNPGAWDAMPYKYGVTYYCATIPISFPAMYREWQALSYENSRSYVRIMVPKWITRESIKNYIGAMCLADESLWDYVVFESHVNSLDDT